MESHANQILNADLRLSIAELVFHSGEGHIPSSFSIVDLVEALYASVLRVDPQHPSHPDRDYFVLSKGHGAAALFSVLSKHQFLSEKDIASYGRLGGILGGHPDATKVPGVEFSTGSLGHGLPMAVGVALGLKIKGSQAGVHVLVGDGECHEGTVWESANVAANRLLDNLIVYVDWNGSASQLMPRDDLPKKWAAFGWETVVIDGHSPKEVIDAASAPRNAGIPRAIIARTTKGRGVDFLEGHGQWHHKVPSKDEMMRITRALNEIGEEN